MRKIGLFGGTFDPPHYGHLIMAEQVYQSLQLDEVWFIPNNQPPHKAEAKSGGSIRLQMTEAAIQDHPAFRVNGMELHREGKSYTIDTIRQLQSEYPDFQFYFIIGGDMVEYLPKWHQIDELMKMVPFVGVNRPGHSMDTAYNVTEVEMPLIDISSTMIRKRAAEGQSIRYFTTPEVRAIIEKSKLYQR
ncbi:nicotinate-nucleotide adenylyltransferase [Gracilibacillus ureilyticus]|uniref:Probable nicotinate-nucleotide adenylyltransferase n=1 Tax=Gracilibacillus ureilyticus TaxID=531814 RepID=A0A1H9RJZ5_9BACI|nr:nicotinate-nucleotide adenylyltransferase [Gracilibacillus ureilyticus]SER72865.1 nicotinate-nucleotide adenylyltransferase [Gracilibacillus ureilyticus]